MFYILAGVSVVVFVIFAIINAVLEKRMATK